MPFKDEFNDIYRLGIKEAATQVGITAERLDEQIFVEGMLERIYRQIDAADIVVADMTGQNPNVFYEVGYAHAKNKLCILLTKDANDIPFDLKHRRHIEYKNSIAYLRDELVKNLQWAKGEIEKVKSSNIRVEFLQPIGDLKTTKFFAYTTVNFKVNIFNESTKPWVDINTIYLYMSKQWTVKQGDKECPSIESDIPAYTDRHFLTPPVPRLPYGSWAQLQLSTSRMLANKLSGNEILNKYRISGDIMLKFITSEGIFDFDYYAVVEVEDIPF